MRDRERSYTREGGRERGVRGERGEYTWEKRERERK